MVLGHLPVKSISRLLVNETTPVDYFIHSPQLCAIEGVGGTNAKSAICLCKDPEAMVVGVPRPSVVMVSKCSPSSVT